jgi:hypothetical protein
LSMFSNGLLMWRKMCAIQIQAAEGNVAF